MAGKPPRGHRVVAFGDSTTALREGIVVYADLLRERLVPSSDVINAGVPGHTTEDGRQRLERDVLDHRPDAVVIQFGLNDSAIDVWRGETGPRVPIDVYVRNLRDFIRRLAERGARVLLMTPNPMIWTDELVKLYGKPPYDPADPDGMNMPLMPYVDAVRDLAREQRVPLVDVHAAFRAYAATAGQALADLEPDGMHPNSAGHLLIADLLLEPLTRALSNMRST